MDKDDERFHWFNVIALATIFVTQVLLVCLLLLKYCFQSLYCANVKNHKSG